MELRDITPVILTFNEEPNIARVLDRLVWARNIVIVDSFSTDRTLAIVDAYPNVRRVQRAFDDFDRQWTYAVAETGIDTEWVLALDADFVVSDAFVRAVEALMVENGVNGYEAPFQVCIYGRPLRRSFYPPRIVLFRRWSVTFSQDGHAHRVRVGGATASLPEPLFLDDRKPLARWIFNQDKYARQERAKLKVLPYRQWDLADRIRGRRILAPIVMLFYCLFVKRMIFAGLPGCYYTYQRVGFEILLSLYLIEDRLAEPGDAAPEPKADHGRR